jgi:hypothetical protein
VGDITRVVRFRRCPALRPIDEAEAYARCHGDRGDEIVRVAPLPQPPSVHRFPATITGESLREAFERRLARRRRST